MHKRTSGWPWISWIALMFWSCLTGASEKSTRVAPCRLAWASESALLQGFGRSMGLRHQVGHDDGKGWIGGHFNGDPPDDRVLFLSWHPIFPCSLFSIFITFMDIHGATYRFELDSDMQAEEAVLARLDATLKQIKKYPEQWPLEVQKTLPAPWQSAVFAHCL